ncbi:hypothetical protein ACX0G9_22015 [Flavitalea flava]
MVEVFKTNVNNLDHAGWLVDRIHRTFPGYRANFDLDDCDRILRVQCMAGFIQSDFVIGLVRGFGFEASILPDEIVSLMRVA